MRCALLPGPVAAVEQLLDQVELFRTTEAPGGGCRELRERPDGRRRRALLVPLEVDERRVEPETGCTPLVLLDQRSRLVRAGAVATSTVDWSSSALIRSSSRAASSKISA
jgi:hypothetical protein